MRFLISCGLILAVAACTALPPKPTANENEASLTRLSGCRFDFAISGGADAICMSGEATLKMSFPACAPGKPTGPLVQVADEQAIFAQNTCISSFGGQKWLVGDA